MELTVLHLLLILIGVIIASIVGYRLVSNNNEPFYDNTTSTKPSPTNPSPTNPSPTNPSHAADSCGNDVSLTGLLGLSGANVPTTLSSGTVINNVPICPEGQSYDINQGICIGISLPTCPTGQTFDQTKGICISNNIIPLSPIQSLAASKACDSNLLQNIQEIVHNELISQNGMTTGTQMAFLGQDSSNTINGKNNKNNKNNDDDEDSTPANYQGKEYRRDCPKNTNMGHTEAPDMSQYIRKDSIPCWGCNIP
jgi:hypothetical protein